MDFRCLVLTSLGQAMRMHPCQIQFLHLYYAA